MLSLFSPFFMDKLGKFLGLDTCFIRSSYQLMMFLGPLNFCNFCRCDVIIEAFLGNNICSGMFNGSSM